MRNPWRRHDGGFTLVELLMAVTILGIIIGPLIAAILVVLNNITATQDRMSSSHGVQILDAYFTADVKSSGSQLFDPVTQSQLRLPVTTTKPSCARVTTTSDVPIVTFAWRDIPYDPSNPVAVDPNSQYRNRWAWYWLARPKLPGGTPDLSQPGVIMRGYCSAVAGSTVAYSETTVARLVKPGTAPTVACGGGCGSAQPTGVTMSGILMTDSSDASAVRNFAIYTTRRVTQ